MAATDVNLYAEQGTTFKTEFTIEDDTGNPVDISGFVITSQFRRSYNSSSFISFSVNKTDPTNGVVELSLSPTQTSSIKAGRYVYDAQYSNSNDVVKFVKGILTMYPSVTR